ncbi:hypothetical protein GCM10027610_081040 [Dactylosporangium cerinum]
MLVHGRAQQLKDPDALKVEWLDALAEGLAKSGLALPVAAADVRFPFYGDALVDRVADVPAELASAVVVRGGDIDDEERQFLREVLTETHLQAGVTAEQITEMGSLDVVQRAGWPDSAWAHAVLKAVDRYVPYASGAGIAVATHDVYRYLTDSLIREEIEEGISAAVTPGVETVVVGHSLGTVVTYNLLRREGHLRGWRVPCFVTLGSPLAVTAIRRKLRSLAPIRRPACVDTWYNARDRRDLVALYPLDTERFPIIPEEPPIQHHDAVRNHTDNRHGIAGYLADAVVARWIHDALTA